MTRPHLEESASLAWSRPLPILTSFEDATATSSSLFPGMGKGSSSGIFITPFPLQPHLWAAATTPVLSQTKCTYPDHGDTLQSCSGEPAHWSSSGSRGRDPGLFWEEAPWVWLGPAPRPRCSVLTLPW